MRNLVALSLIPLAACTSIETADPAPPAIDACLPANLDRFAGQTATSELGSRMLVSTGKTALRWVQPGMMVTMDYREDRLTVYLDAANKVERAICG
ncbi:I78 family peptidase inhibitor [Sphingomonas sp.]|uniref:I78 family peptidase inhibitor n=1 Tax=Sphingomonas sp. TaxID=28214 RepID=UPI00286C80A4|nr:I78 family peptidase inhibitor [Sphingomonas sp.]